MSWTREEEDALVERNTRSLQALAEQHGTSITPTLAQSIAFEQALGTLHARELRRALHDYILAHRSFRRRQSCVEEPPCTDTSSS